MHYNMYIHIYIYTYIHTYIHTYTHQDLTHRVVTLWHVILGAHGSPASCRRPQQGPHYTLLCYTIL